MNAFTIKDLENLSGIKAHTIRIWEQRYSFLQPHRTQTNIRYYSGEQLKMILNISLLNKFGFKISHIDKMNADEMQQKILSLTHAEAVQQRIINELVQLMIDLEIPQFEAVLNRVIAEKGIEKAIMQVIFPFLEKIGVLWLTNHINPAQEHLVSHVIRQKLIVGIEYARPASLVNESVLMFLPENEHHEIGLLFMYFLLKTKGYQVYYVGADVPLKDVASIVQVKRPNHLFTHLTTIPKRFNLERYLNQLRSLIPDTPLVLSGTLTQQYSKPLPPKVQLGHSLQEALMALTGRIV